MYCPYCDEKLKYIGIDATFDVITEEWYCENCQEFIYFDEAGLRHRDEVVIQETEVIYPD